MIATLSALYVAVMGTVALIFLVANIFEKKF